MIISGYWLTLLPLIPLVSACSLLMFAASKKVRMFLAVCSTMPALVIALLPAEYTSVQVSGLLLGTHFALNDSDGLFLLLTAFVWLIATLYSRQYFSSSQRCGFTVLFLFTMAGNMGAIVADDILAFYFFFALMSFSAYGLLIHNRTPQAMRAGRIYMIFVLLGEVMLLSALMLAASSTQTSDFDSFRNALLISQHRDLIILLLVMGLGIKTGLPGLHFTLPLTYGTAPLPVTLVLAGAMVNVGLLGWLQLLPLGQIALAGWSTIMMSLGICAMFFGVVFGLMQRENKTLLAYSSISQMGIATLAIGFALAAPQTWPGVLMAISIFVVHHGLAKTALFAGLETVQQQRNKTYWKYLFALGLLLPALTLAGAPMSSGMLAKLMLKNEMYPPVVFGGWTLNDILTASSIATTLLMARFVYLAWPLFSDSGNPERQVTENRFYWPWAALLIASLTTVWFIPQTANIDVFSLSLWWQSAWPILCGVGVAYIAVNSARTWKFRIPQIPSGDALILIELTVQYLGKIQRSSVMNKLCTSLDSNPVQKIHRRIVNALQALDLIENKIANWAIPATLLVLFIVLLIGVAYAGEL
ncbi:MAG: complex I subunit 5 family protein [Gammaproteobacteria bacterium]|nr:complex I subunit 5 family protein [Gammaproteobacteria bacterium]